MEKTGFLQISGLFKQVLQKQQFVYIMIMPRVQFKSFT